MSRFYFKANKGGVSMSNLEEMIKDEMKFEVYNALSDVMYNHADCTDCEFLKQSMEEAFEWFMIKFFEDGE